MMAGPAWLVVLLCVCEVWVGVGGAQEIPSLSDMWREIRVLRGDNEGWFNTFNARYIIN